MTEISITETLEYQDLPSDLRIAVIADEIIEGIREPLIFTNLLSEFSLIGKVGRELIFPIASQLGASGITSVDETEPETSLASEYQPDDKTITHIALEVTELTYCAVELSDVLSEDFPKIDWVRLNLRNMGGAIGDYMETATRDLFEAGAGRTVSCADLSYSKLVDAMAVFKNAKWMPEIGNAPSLIISPDAEAVLLKDKDYISTERYTTSMLENMVAGESGHFAGLRILISPLLNDTGYAYIKFPEKQYGTIAGIVWKRKLRTKTEYNAKTEVTFMVSSVRYGLGIVNSDGLMRISITNSP